MKVGDEAGTTTVNGYRQVIVEGDAYFAHRIAWYLHFGEDPGNMIDHKDRQKSNNRITNLRISNHSTNAHNHIRKGYRKRGDSYQVRVKNKGKVYTKSFKTEDEARQAYMDMKTELSGEFSPYVEGEL